MQITQKVFGTFIWFLSQIKDFRMTIYKRKFEINQTSSFFANSNLPKLDFSEKKSIFSYFCMKHNLDSLPWFTLFIIAQKPTNEYCWSFTIRLWTMNKFSTIYSEFQLLWKKIKLNYNSLKQLIYHANWSQKRLRFQKHPFAKIQIVSKQLYTLNWCVS